MDTDTPPAPLDPLADNAAADALDAQIDALEAVLEDLRTRDDEVPQWEFCEGFMAALICCRRPIPASEYLPVLFDLETQGQAGLGPFADTAQRDQFMALWQQRWEQMAQALDTDIELLSDDRAYVPALLDVRGALAGLSPAQRDEFEADLGDALVPSYGQIWAVGFMYAVETWPEEWTAPRDREAAKLLDAALQSIIALTEDDTGPQTVSLSDDDDAPSLSQQRMDELAAALSAVYELRALWQHIGPRVATVHRAATPGRNDPCPCGSGKKYKKCCGL